MKSIPIGRYLLTEKLAIGGTAEIFKAKLVGVEGFEKVVAIKRILPHWSSNAGFISMLVDEAKIMVRLAHERVVQVYELNKEDEIYYLVMEYVDGVDLRKLGERAKQSGTPLAADEISFILAETLRGLAYIHSQKDEQGVELKIIHRDISPQNLLISREGAIKITDFGIAHAASRSYETATGMLKGKFSYMSPEQARGTGLDQKTDLFAAAIILYEFLAGKKLFSANSDLGVLEAVRLFKSERLLTDEAIPDAFRPLLVKALHEDPKQRYADAMAFLDDLLDLRRTLGYFSDSHALSKRFRLLFPEGLPLFAQTNHKALVKEKKRSGREVELEKGNTDLAAPSQIKKALESFESPKTPPADEITRSLEISFLKQHERKVIFAISVIVMLIGFGVVFYLERQGEENRLALKTNDPFSIKQNESETLSAKIVFTPTPSVETNALETRLALEPIQAETLSSTKKQDPVALIYNEKPETFSAVSLNNDEKSKANEKKPAVKTLTPAEESKKREEEAEKRKQALLKLAEQERREVEKVRAENPSQETIKPAAAGKGQLAISVSPWGDLTLDGDYKGNAAQFGPYTLPYKTYQIRVGYAPDKNGRNSTFATGSVKLGPTESRKVCKVSFKGKSVQGNQNTYVGTVSCGLMR